MRLSLALLASTAFAAVPRAPAPTAAPNPAAIAAPNLIPRTVFARTATTGDACFDTHTISTTTCPVETVDGSPTTHDCTSTQVTSSECAAGLMCTMDSSGEDICMELQNDLGVDGIIIAIIFAAFIALGVGALTWMCCRDKREQKRVAARVEATQLARARTKKMAAEQRAPLMRGQGQGQGEAEGQTQDPFGDGRQM